MSENHFAYPWFEKCHLTHLRYVPFIFRSPPLLKSGLNRYFCPKFMSLSSQNKKKDTETRKNKIKREGFVKIYLTLSFLFSIKLPLNSQNSSPEWVYRRGTWVFGKSWCWDQRAWGGGDVADRCLVVALVAGFGIVVDCGLVMRSVSWWLLGLVHVFALSFNDC